MNDEVERWENEGGSCPTSQSITSGVTTTMLKEKAAQSVTGCSKSIQMYDGKTSTKEPNTTLEVEMAETQLKQAVSQSGKTYSLTGATKRTKPRNHSKDREARELYLNRKNDRPVQLTSPSTEHVVGWAWTKVGVNTLTDLEESIEELEDC